MMNEFVTDKDNKSGINKLILSNFRSYKKLSFQFENKPIVLIGNNGVGKTNILESISLFSSNKGIRRAKTTDFLHQPIDCISDNKVTVSIKINDNNIDQRLGLTIEYNEENNEKFFKINGNNIKNQTTFKEYLNIFWITPQMDKVFAEGVTSRRKFLDKIVCNFHCTHSNALSKYEYLLRERMLLLKYNKETDKWLSSIEKQISELAIVIATSRLQTIDMLKQAQQYVLELFPVADFYIDGDCEYNILQQSAVEAEDIFKVKLLDNRSVDKESGRTNYGVHRSDFKVIFANKGILAEQCSTGEQKALLISIILTASRLQVIKGNACPILLLDEIIAHLDKSRQRALLQEILHLKIQAWITATDVEIFKEYKDCFQIFKIVDGQLEKL